MADPSEAVRRLKLRPWVRAIHRDLGYLAVGLTVVYAVSGVALNHLADWDPNFVTSTRTLPWTAPLPAGDADASTAIQTAFGLEDAATDAFRLSATEAQFTFPGRTIQVDTVRGSAIEKAQEPRFFLRVANWLHLNRGKSAWIYFADGYAIGLLVLAGTGLAMIPGRKGFFWRGLVLTAAGAAVPIVYLQLAGGP
jgi:uncharacterized protein